jgi:sec-independent protein translocase protein TatA
MGMGGISFGSLLLIFLIVIVLFGTKRLREVGEDLGHAVRNFRKGLAGIDEDLKKPASLESSEDRH